MTPLEENISKIAEARNDLSDLLETYRNGQGIEDPVVDKRLREILDILDAALWGKS